MIFVDVIKQIESTCGPHMSLSPLLSPSLFLFSQLSPLSLVPAGYISLGVLSHLPSSCAMVVAEEAMGSKL